MEQQTFNRTISELKLLGGIMVGTNLATFNRTISELKLR